MAIEAKIARGSARWVVGETERLVDRIEHCALVHAVVTAHAIGVCRAIQAEGRIVAAQTGVLMNAHRDSELFLGMQSGRGLPGIRPVAIQAGVLECCMAWKRAAFELGLMTAEALVRRPSEARRTP